MEFFRPARILILFLGVSLNAVANGQTKGLCISNAREYEEHKAELPKVVQLPVQLATAEEGVVVGGLRLFLPGEKLKVEGAVMKPGTDVDFKDDTFLSMVCIRGSDLEVILQSGTTIHAKILSDRAVSIRGFVFARMDNEARFAELVEIARGQKSKKTSSPGGENGTAR